MSRRIVGTLIFGDQDPVEGGELRLTALDNYEGATGVMRQSTATIPVDQNGHYDFPLELGGYKAEYAYESGEVIFLGLAQCDYGADVDLLSLIAPFGGAPQPADYAGIIEQLKASFRGSVIVKTASFTIDNNSQNTVFVCDSSGTIDVTLPAGLPEGWYVTIVKRGKGDVNIVSDGTSTVETAEPFVATLRTQHSVASAFRMEAASEIWEVSGDLKDTLP